MISEAKFITDLGELKVERLKMMAAYALRPLLLYIHLHAQLVARKPALDDPHTKRLPVCISDSAIV